MSHIPAATHAACLTYPRIYSFHAPVFILQLSIHYHFRDPNYQTIQPMQPRLLNNLKLQWPFIGEIRDATELAHETASSAGYTV